MIEDRSPRPADPSYGRFVAWAKRAMEAMLQMKKLNVEELREASEGVPV